MLRQLNFSVCFSATCRSAHLQSAFLRRPAAQDGLEPYHRHHAGRRREEPSSARRPRSTRQDRSVLAKARREHDRERAPAVRAICRDRTIGGKEKWLRHVEPLILRRKARQKLSIARLGSNSATSAA